MHAKYFFLMALTFAASAAAEDLVIESAILTLTQQAEIPARESGLLTELLVREGQLVKAGEVIGHLDDSAEKLTYHRAAIELERSQKLAANDVKVRLAKKELEIAESELSRAVHASDRVSRSVTESELDRLRLNVQRAALEAEQAAIDLETARFAMRICENELQAATEKLRRRQITAPISGFVVVVQRRMGEWIEGGQAVSRVINTDRLRAEGFLNADQVVPELLGHKVQFAYRKGEMPPEHFEGRIVFVSPEVDPVNGQVRVWAEIDNSRSRLRPGLTGTVVIPP